MTGIIFRGLDRNSFSFTKFYISRASRIIPPLLTLCITLLILGWFFLTPSDYRNLGINSAASSIFISNIIYWLESGYFAPGVDNNLLLHTWSLSVEWQFYIIWPIILVILHKTLNLKNLKLVIIFFTAVGFIYNIYTSLTTPDSSYYLLSSRFWEMSAGGLAFLYPIKTTKSKELELLGFILVVSSFFIVSKSELWPGYMSILPVLGTY
jgi:peptidoglycan/LPS O-acetylase OafA/YrhL